jgi:uncharacterized protein YceK
MSKFVLGVVAIGFAALLSGCASVVGDADAGPNPGGGFYGAPNVNVGQVNPPGFQPVPTLAERP